MPAKKTEPTSPKNRSGFSVNLARKKKAAISSSLRA